MNWYKLHLLIMELVIDLTEQGFHWDQQVQYSEKFALPTDPEDLASLREDRRILTNMTTLIEQLKTVDLELAHLTMVEQLAFEDFDPGTRLPSGEVV